MRTKENRGASLRFGIIGAGRISQSYVQAFKETVNAQLAGLVDINDEAAGRMAAEAGCPVYASLAELIETAKVDAVIVATPPSTHEAICLEILDRGVALLCEKPVSLTVESARKIRQRSLERRVPFTMASKFRYVADVVNARKIIDSGIVGDIALFENTFMSYVDMGKRWNSNRSVSGGGVFIDNGTHSVDIMRYFIGPLAMIHAVEGPGVQNLSVEETVHITARTARGAIGRMDLSWSINKQCDDYIAIYGSKGTLRVGWKASLYRQAGSSSWVQFGSGYDRVQAFREQLSNFSAAVQGLEELLIDADDAVASVEVIRAGYESLANASWTSISVDSLPSVAASYAA